MTNYGLMPADYEKILAFTSDIMGVKENIRPLIQQKLAEHFGYERTVMWYADHEGNLFNPSPHQFSEQVLNAYTSKYCQYDFLHPKKNLSLFKQHKALRLVDLIDEQHMQHSVFYCQFLKKFHLHDEMVITFTYNETLIGVLGMARTDDEHKYSQRDQKILQLLSDIIGPALSHDVKPTHNPLSKRELELVTLLKHGWTNQKIADELYISVNTVKKHLQSIYRKCNVHNKTQLVQKF